MHGSGPTTGAEETREAAPWSPPVVLTVAGSDSGGGAGVQADLKTIEAHGAYAASVLTAVTAQHTRGVDSTHLVPVEEIAAQYDAVTGDLDVDAVKTGMLATADVVDLVADRAAGLDVPLVVDPVMVAASGDRLLDPAAEDAYDDLLAHATVATPNADEAAVLAGVDVRTEDDAVEAGGRIVEAGADAALVTGGHVAGGTAVDVLVTDGGVRSFGHPWVDTAATHGSGCALASAIAARLARGDDLHAAVEGAADYLARAVRYPIDVGDGPGAVHHLVGLRERAARNETGAAVEALVSRFVEADVRPAVPEVGMNVAGATPQAESVGEVAAVDGRITRTLSGVDAGCIRFGASSHVARFLLAAREVDPALRFAANCRFDDDVEAALDALDWTVAEVDRAAEPESATAAEGRTMQWVARQAVERGDAGPVVVFDRGDVGKEPMVRLLASDAKTLAGRVLALADAIR